MIIHTIGHSTRTLDELVGLLGLNRIDLLADIRAAPASRRVPHFAKSALEQELSGRGIAYVHLAGLGGLRKGVRGSVNAGWRNASFRAFADYMQEPEFWSALQELLELAGGRSVAIMCAEAVPWRCHRTLVADALVINGAEVRHITGKGEPSRHSLTPFAAVDGGRIVYPEQGGAAPRPDKLPTHG